MTTAEKLQKTSNGPAELLGLQFAKYMELRGRRIVEFGGVLWQSVAGRMFISIPCQLLLEWPSGEVGQFLRLSRGLGVRFPSLTRDGLGNGLYVYRGQTYGLEDMHRNFRQKVRHGLPHCEIRAVSHDELVGQGLALNIETMQRQRRYDPEFGDRPQFERLVDAVFRVPAMGAVGAFVDGRLSAYDITCRENGWLHIVHKMSRLSDLEYSPNHVLDFCVTRDAVADPEIEAVTMGWQSLFQMDGLHDYKTRLGYTLETHRTVIQFHPAFSSLLCSDPAARAAARLRAWLPNNNRLALAEALVNAGRLSQSGVAYAR